MVVIYYDGDPRFGVIPPDGVGDQDVFEFVSDLVIALNALEKASPDAFEWYASELGAALLHFGFRVSDLVPADTDVHWRVDI